MQFSVFGRSYISASLALESRSTCSSDEVAGLSTPGLCLGTLGVAVGHGGRSLGMGLPSSHPRRALIITSGGGRQNKKEGCEGATARDGPGRRRLFHLLRSRPLKRTVGFLPRSTAPRKSTVDLDEHATPH